MTPPMRLIYIAGPYTALTAADVAENVQRARRVADRVNRDGGGRCFAVTPHFLGSGIEDSGDPQFWYDATMAVLRRCDAVALVDGWEKSKGALEEVAEADRLGLPVFESPDLLVRGRAYTYTFADWATGGTP